MPNFKALFESKPCGRCGGSGSHSYCQRYGSTCFKCGGKGVVLTPRGQAAQHFLDALRQRTADQLAVGDTIRFDGMGGSKWVKITEIKRGKSDTVGAGTVNGEAYDACVIVADGCIYNGRPSTTYRKAFSAEEKAEQIKQALAYQDTLTARGEPKKTSTAKGA